MIKLAYCQRSRFLVSLQICNWVCQPNQFSRIESCNTNSQLLASSPLFIFPTPAIDLSWFTQTVRQKPIDCNGPTPSSLHPQIPLIWIISIKKGGNKLVKSYQQAVTFPYKPPEQQCNCENDKFLRLKQIGARKENQWTLISIFYLKLW